MKHVIKKDLQHSRSITYRNSQVVGFNIHQFHFIVGHLITICNDQAISIMKWNAARNLLGDSKTNVIVSPSSPALIVMESSLLAQRKIFDMLEREKASVHQQ